MGGGPGPPSAPSLQNGHGVVVFPWVVWGSEGRSVAPDGDPCPALRGDGRVADRGPRCPLACPVAWCLTLYVLTGSDSSHRTVPRPCAATACLAFLSSCRNCWQAVCLAVPRLHQPPAFVGAALSRFVSFLPEQEDLQASVWDGAADPRAEGKARVHRGWGEGPVGLGASRGALL